MPPLPPFACRMPVFAAACLTVLSAAAAPVSLQGTLDLPGTDANATFSYVLTVPSLSSVTLQSLGHGGGVNGAGATIPAGGFDSYLAVFTGGDSLATFRASNDDGACPPGTLSGGKCADPTLALTLPAGTYTVVLSAFANLSLAENLGTGTLGDGFTGLGNHDPGRTTAYALDIDVVPLSDVSVTQSAYPSPAATGRDVMFTLTSTNNSGLQATNVVVSDTLPAGSSFVWASPGCINSVGTVVCAVGAVAPGATDVRKVVVRPAAAGSITNNIVVNSAQADAFPGNNASGLSVAVNASAAGVAVQRYRLFSPVTLEHLYTTDLNEYNVLGSFVGTWVQEGPVGKVFNNPGSLNGVPATPYYRLYNTSNAQHHWTTDPNEYYTLILFPQYNPEGVDGYIFPTQAAGTIPLFRLLYPFSVPVAGLHHWTIDPVEYSQLIGVYGWMGEGGSGFVIP